MQFIFCTVVLGFFLALSSGWIPGEDKDLRALAGTTLFKTFSSDAPVNERSIAIPSAKIRGVNLGSLFVFEPWIAMAEWSSMGCVNTASEFGCVSTLGQAAANKSFANHWDTWIDQGDFETMQSYGLNTIRIPVGYWMMESLVYTSEHFPQGGLEYLQRICGWASDAGFFIIIDLHGAPGAQTANNSDTGQAAKKAGFYTTKQYQRAISFVSWLANLIHTVDDFRNVGMVGILNEPVQNVAQAKTMVDLYYPEAYSAIREVESTLSISQANSLHVQFMNKLWGSGDPNSNLSGTFNVAYDDHRYIKRDPNVDVTHAAYLQSACNNNRNSDKESPTIVGEFSISPPDDVEDISTWSTTGQAGFYTDWFAAQVTTFEKDTNGWVFWTWKTQLGDYRWSYMDAVAAGVIPLNLSDIDTGVCDGSRQLGCGSQWAWFVLAVAIAMLFF